VGVFTNLSDPDAARVLAAYGLGAPRSVRGIPAGSVNSNYALEHDGGRVFVRIYEEQDAAGAAAEARLLGELATRGVRTPAPLALVAGAEPALVAGKPVAVFPWRDGEMRCQASVSPLDASRVGAELARVHVAGEGLAVGEGRFRLEDLRDRIVRIAAADDAELAAQAAVLGEKLGRWSAARDPGAPAGLIHGDLFRDNVLWSQDGTVAALLDFESASRGVFAFDVMVTVLSWSFGDGLHAGIARAIVDGYRSVRELAEGERAALLAEGCFAATRFAITRITDYAMMRKAIGARVIKDWRRFAMRLATLEGLGQAGLTRVLFG
jgi:homoserine kinase type II